jgi:zinc transporter ZupT
MANILDGEFQLKSSSIFRIALTVACAAPIISVTGCSRVPTFDILGSFFPAWILCGVAGVLLTVGMRVLFVRMKFEEELSPLALIYPCLAAFFTFSVWLLFFS